MQRFLPHLRTLLTFATATLSAIFLLLTAPPAAYADGLDKLRAFVRDVSSARATFTQVVTSSDGVKKKTSSGIFEFARPNRFRFDYQKPYPQLIVGDGEKVWLHDPDLQQVTVRAMDKALGATPAALLAGQGLDKDFETKAMPAADGLDWVQALPRVKEGAAFTSMKLGFRDTALAVVEIVDNFDQRTMIRFDAMTTNLGFAPEHFAFKPPQGASVLQQ
jgi:outer membrane lipoprotein carrier protein